jgi:hypothetical protein
LESILDSNWPLEAIYIYLIVPCYCSWWSTSDMNEKVLMAARSNWYPYFEYWMSSA